MAGKRGRSNSATAKKGKRTNTIKKSSKVMENAVVTVAVEKVDSAKDNVAPITTTISVETTVQQEDDIDIFLSPNTEDGANIATDFLFKTRIKPEEEFDIYADKTLIGSDDDVKEAKAEETGRVEVSFDNKLTDDEPDTFHGHTTSSRRPDN
jgi:hypothetical protein